MKITLVKNKILTGFKFGDTELIPLYLWKLDVLNDENVWYNTFQDII